jgi:DNA modification methylase
MASTASQSQLTLEIAPLARRGTEANLDDKFAAHREAWVRRPAILKNHHRIFLGDARELPGLPAEETVQLVVTSPPYWNLKRYRDDCDGMQLGHIEARKEFLDELGKVWRHCYRMLTPGGRLCIVVGDVCRSRKNFGRHIVEPLHAYLQVQCQELGFDPLAPIIWHKIANVATEVAGNGSTFLGKPYEPNAIVKNDIEFILLFRKPGGYRQPTQEQRDLSMIKKDDHRRWFQQIWDDIRGEIQRGHPAPFPVEVARRLIGMFSYVGDTVFDPFWGTGSTTRAAIDLYRSSIGFEIDPEYVRLGVNRLGILPPETTVEVHN